MFSEKAGEIQVRGARLPEPWCAPTSEPARLPCLISEGHGNETKSRLG